MYWIVWLGIMLVLLAIEFLTVDMVSIWFAASALLMVVVTAIFSQIPFIWQLCGFLVVSVVLVLSTRKIVKRLMKSKKDKETNLELVINHTGRVVEEINNDREAGAVKINGIVWTARSAQGEIVAEDELVTVLQIKGNKLIVTKK